jgi:hypothetical protein
MRSNLIPPGADGEVLTAKGIIYHPDGKKPLANTLVEAWQCKQDQTYDNTSDDYLFRGAIETESDGKYEFKTLRPPPYPANNFWRPAHIHFRISHPDYQDLITQIYFEGGDYLETDPFSSAQSSASRILKVTSNDMNGREVIFDVIMAKSFPLDDSGYSSIEGLYKLDGGIAEFERKDDLLFFKLNGQIREGMAFKGKNCFEGALGTNRVRFEFLPDGKTKCYLTTSDMDGFEDRRQEFEGFKFMKYPA